VALNYNMPMNWNNILKIKRWTPLATLQIAAKETGVPKVLSVFENCYIHVQDHNAKLEKYDQDAPFVVKAYWAESEAALQRVATSGPLTDVAMPIAKPPVELLSGTDGTFGQLIVKATKAAKEGNKPVGEALYTRGGHFKYQVLTIDQLDYCFLSNEARDGDKVFAIMVSLMAA